jgi:hypothetical protein
MATLSGNQYTLRLVLHNVLNCDAFLDAIYVGSLPYDVSATHNSMNLSELCARSCNYECSIVYDVAISPIKNQRLRSTYGFR